MLSGINTIVYFKHFVWIFILTIIPSIAVTGEVTYFHYSPRCELFETGAGNKADPKRFKGTRSNEEAGRKECSILIHKKNPKWNYKYCSLSSISIGPDQYCRFRDYQEGPSGFVFFKFGRDAAGRWPSCTFVCIGK